MSKIESQKELVKSKNANRTPMIIKSKELDLLTSKYKERRNSNVVYLLPKNTKSKDTDFSDSLASSDSCSSLENNQVTKRKPRKNNRINSKSRSRYFSELIYARKSTMSRL